jgi:hypothetical protein
MLCAQEHSTGCHRSLWSGWRTAGAGRAGARGANPLPASRRVIAAAVPRHHRARLCRTHAAFHLAPGVCPSNLDSRTRGGRRVPERGRAARACADRGPGSRVWAHARDHRRAGARARLYRCGRALCTACTICGQAEAVQCANTGSGGGGGGGGGGGDWRREKQFRSARHQSAYATSLSTTTENGGSREAARVETTAAEQSARSIHVR